MQVCVLAMCAPFAIHVDRAALQNSVAFEAPDAFMG